MAWIGDSNNVCNSYIEAASLFNFSLNIFCPKGFEPNPEIIKKQKTTALTKTKEEAKGAKIVTTDVWTSMHSGNKPRKTKIFEGYSIDPSCMIS